MHAIVPNPAPFGVIKHTRVYRIHQTIGFNEFFWGGGGGYRNVEIRNGIKKKKGRGLTERKKKGRKRGE